MSEQCDNATVYLDGFLAGYNGYVNANPYCIVGPNNLWAAYENGFTDGIAAKKRQTG